MSSTKRSLPVANRLLAALPKKEYQRLLPRMELVDLNFAEVLYEPGASVRHIYFPNDSIISLLAGMDNRATLEVGMVGNEGMVGINIFMGLDTMRYRAVVQGTGSAMRMKAETLRREAGQIGAFHNLLHRYSHSRLTQVSQSAICNRFHTVNARLARWLLMTRDRMASDEFRLTQEFMSNMLGVRREGVTGAAGNLQRAKLVRYSRGQLKILNGPGLEAISCACYQIIKDESDSYLSVN